MVRQLRCQYCTWWCATASSGVAPDQDCCMYPQLLLFSVNRSRGGLHANSKERLTTQMGQMVR